MSESEEREPQTSDITEAEKVEFLRSIYEGLNRQEAAKALGYKGRHFRALCSPQSPFYDEEFAHSYGQAISSLEFETHRLERLREEGFRRAMTDSDRLLERYLMVYDPDFAVLRQKDININIRGVIQNYFRSLPTEKLEQLLQWVDEQQTVEGEALELPPAVTEAA